MNTLKPISLKLTLVALWVASFFLLFAQSAHAQTAVTPPTVPDNLKTAAEEVPFLKVSAKGVQIYRCTVSATDATKFEWTLKAPEADLFDEQGKKIGIHYAGPTWEANDGSKVVGEVKDRANAPDGKGIAWLLLKAKSVEGNGILSKVSSIQRVDTVAGFAPPAAECNASRQDNHEARVDYTTNYYFYSAASTVPVKAPASGQGGTQYAQNFAHLSVILALAVVMLVSLGGLVSLKFFRRQK